MPQGKIVSIRLSEHDLAELDRHVATIGVDRSAWVRQVIMEAMGKPAPVPRPRVPGAKQAEQGPPSGIPGAPPLPPLDPDGPCQHPEEWTSHTAKITVCTLCGSRL